MIRPVFINSEVYHVYNRGVEKRIVFSDDRDRFRFIHDLYEFNDRAPVPPSNIRLGLRNPAQCLGVQLPNIEQEGKREQLVEILAFCLMPNHFHLLLRQVTGSGISKFMQKLGTGYTNYFNLKNSRVGSLFQGRFKAVMVQEDKHLRYLYNYIHLNPLDIYTPEWRESKIANPERALKILESYRWSSYLDFTGKKNFPSVINKEFSMYILGNKEEYYNNLREWLSDMQKNSEEIRPLILE